MPAQISRVKIQCDGKGMKGIDDVAPGKRSRCPVCTAKPTTDAAGLIKRHEQLSPRDMTPKNSG